MKAISRKILLLALAFLGVGVLYIPFRFFAQRFNIASPSYIDPRSSEVYHSDNFYYWFSIFVWPIYSLLFGFLPLFCACILRVRWYIYVAVCIALLFLLCNITIVDTWLDIPGGGLSGFTGGPSNNPGINTPLISVIMCPFAILAGGILGILFAKRRIKRATKLEVDV
ncbi:MAG: hypothetical protein ACYSUY_10140 [Planctomycetota bacterium]